MVLLISLNVGGYSGRNILDSPLSNLSVNTQRGTNININTDIPPLVLKKPPKYRRLSCVLPVNNRNGRSTGKIVDEAVTPLQADPV